MAGGRPETSTGPGGPGASAPGLALLSFERPAGESPVAPSPDLENCTVGQTTESPRAGLACGAALKITVVRRREALFGAVTAGLSTITVKIVRAHGGCLGIRSRGRAWTAAIS